jgi:phosphatidylcholine synthase
MEASTGRNRTSDRVRVTPIRGTLAWGVHALTASGAVIGVAALVAIGHGALEAAAVLLLLAFAIDSVDGALARAVGVSRVLPQIDGRRLDDMVDFLNYVIVPAVFMVAAGTLPHWGVAAIPVLASCYGFSRVDAKTEDDFFLGFPSYWNFVALYAWGLGVSAVTGTLVVTCLSVLVFIPFKYAYPSKLRRLRGTTALLGTAWCMAVAVCFIAKERLAGFPLLEITLLFPVYYFAISFWLGGLQRGET